MKKQFFAILFTLVLLLLSLVTLSLVAKAAITNSSRVIPYQGRLTDSSGNNVADGTYAMTFKIYTVSSGGSAAFTETFSAGNAVTVTSGLFSVLLGSLSANGVNLDFANPPYYLGITIAANSEMTPRIQLGFAPLAHNSQYLDGTPLSSFQLNTGVLTGAAGTNTRLQATGTGTGSTGNGSIYFLDSSGNTKGRFETTASGASSTGNVAFTSSSSYTQEDLAYSVTLTPSATSGSITLTLGSGSWNSDSRIKNGCQVIGNGGIASITAAPAAQTTITASVDTSFTNTNAISSGSWNLYCSIFSGGVAKINTTSAPTSETFSYTGSQQTFTVPAGVTSAIFETWGAQGSGSNGGLGGYAIGTLSVTGGSSYPIFVGGQAGYNGGGTTPSANPGGGASDVRYGGTALGNRILVAGGGGGGSGGGAGGVGGASTGGNGVDAGYPSLCYGGKGYGGTQSAGGSGGGAGGSDYGYPGTAGSGGSLGQGGVNGTYWNGNGYGGGGGGGYYGGGGAGGGGAYNSPPCYTTSAGGGGGSNYISGSFTSTTSSAGVRSGNGQVVVTYNITVAPTSTYYTLVTGSDQMSTSNWTDIDSVTVTETLNSQTIYYSVSFDGRTTFYVHDGSSSAWRPIARNNSGTWQYNSNATYGSTTWTNATTNTMNAALSQAEATAANRMTGTVLNSVSDAHWNDTNGYTTSVTTLDFSVSLQTSSASQIPQVDNIAVAYTSGYGTMYLGATNTSSADVAEYYAVKDRSIEAGDVVALDPNENELLVKASVAFDPNLIGVISTAPGVLLGDKDKNNDYQRKLALTGRVPVKIDPNSKPIKIGDFLTSSSKPGYAQKADRPGFVLGRALENWKGQEKINVFINLTYFPGNK